MKRSHCYIDNPLLGAADSHKLGARKLDLRPRTYERYKEIALAHARSTAFKVYPTPSGRWCWRTLDRNNLWSDGSESFVNEHAAWHDICKTYSLI